MTSTISTAQESEQPSVISVKHIPTDIDGNKIEWDDNPAYLAARLRRPAPMSSSSLVARRLHR